MSNRLEKKGKFCRFLADRVRRNIVIKFGCYIYPKAEIADPVTFPHPVGIVIGEGVVIGENAKIYQNVTIGAARVGEGLNGYYPKIGKNITIYAGAVIFGDVILGDNVVVGANAVVNSAVADGQTVVSAPAKPIKIT